MVYHSHVKSLCLLALCANALRSTGTRSGQPLLQRVQHDPPCKPYTP